MLRADFADVFWPSSSTVARTADDYESAFRQYGSLAVPT